MAEHSSLLTPDSKILFITDLDGTLLPESKIPNPADLAAIQAIKVNDGLFTLATGRNLQSTAKFFGVLKPNAPVILSNGGMIYDIEKDKILHAEYLPESAYGMTENITAAFPHIGVEINTEGLAYNVRTSRVEEEHIRLSYLDNEFKVMSLSEAAEEKWLKVLFAAEPDEITELIAYIDTLGYKDADFVRSSGIYYEMLPKGCTKGSALKKLVDLYGLNDYVTVAAGDYYNDIEMLEAADIAAAPRNAIEPAKAVADYIAEASCEEGFIAEAVQYVVNS